MLDKLRKNASGLVAQILIAFLVLSFAVWGINDMFRARIDTTVAEVGDTEIDATTFMLEYQRALDTMGERLGRAVSLQEGRKFGVDMQVLRQMIAQTALDKAAADLGMAASDEMVAAEIYNDPSFHGPTGEFDRVTYEQVLSANRVSEEFLVQDRRAFLKRSQLIEAVSNGISLPEGFAETYFSIVNETRIANYVVLTPDLVPMPEDPDEETLTNYYEGRAAGIYQQPEYRSFSYVVMTPESVAKTIEVSGEEVAAAFEARKDEFGTPEKRTIEQITFDTEEEAQAAYDRLNEGATFAAIAEDKGLAEDDYKLGTLTKAQFFAKELGDAAFSLEEGAFSEPVQGPLGWVLIHVTDVVPAEEKTLADVRDSLRDEIALDRAYNQLYDMANDLEDSLAGGDTLADAANRHGLELRSVPAVTAKGLDANGKRPDAVPAAGEILAAAFEAGSAEDIALQELPDGTYFWVDVNEVTPARIRPLEEVRGEVVARWKSEERERLLLRKAADLAERINNGESLDAVAEDLGRSVLTTQPLTRDMSNETFSRMAVNNLFAVGDGQATYAQVAFGSSAVLMQVAEITQADAQAKADDFADFRTRLDLTFANDLMAEYVQSLRDRYGVEVNPGAVSYAIGGGDGA